MDLDNPFVSQFAQAVDLACGRMVALGFPAEGMYYLADELACMFSNDSFERAPKVPHARDLYRVMVAIKCHLRGQTPSEEDLAAFGRLALLGVDVPARAR